MGVRVVKRGGYDYGYDVWVGNSCQWIGDAQTAYAIAETIRSIERQGGSVTTDKYGNMEVDGQYIGDLKKLVGR